MNGSSITREQRLLAAAAASAVFVISLFMPWYESGGESASGDEVVPSWWLLLIPAAAAAVLLAADALNFELPPRIDPLATATVAIAFAFVVTLMFFLDVPDGVGRDFGIFLALVFGAIATAVTGLLWREGRGLRA